MKNDLTIVLRLKHPSPRVYLFNVISQKVAFPPLDEKMPICPLITDATPITHRCKPDSGHPSVIESFARYVGGPDYRCSGSREGTWKQPVEETLE